MQATAAANPISQFWLGVERTDREGAAPGRGGTGGRGRPGLRGQPEPSQTWMVQGGGEREGAAVPQCWIAEGVRVA